MRKLLIALALAGAALPAAAEQKTYAVYMSIPCEAYIQERWDPQGVRYKQIQAWISGYVTAYNGWQADTHDILGDGNVANVEAWIENYCKTNPLNNLSNAMAELIGGLYATRQRTAIDTAR
ncbi:MAG: hypothetical protein K0R53_650 [Burkholderiales bacterium]|jgi:hypothetical protein|nr:hypothetical protein [Burkholderiales bacterium]HJQ64068.1 hypothetical protein [Burkholderiales bacterium]